MDTWKQSLLFLPAHELQQRLATGQTTSVELANLFLDQIDRHNHQGRKLRAVLSTVPRDVAVRHAWALDEERARGSVRGALHGIPIIVKDVVVTDESLGMPTTVGSAVFATLKPKKNATLINRLRDAGLMILGKGNMTEFLGLKTKGLPLGWSAYGGQTLSAYRREDLAEEDQPTAAGSSSGPALSITAGFSPLGIASETTGSAVFPAAANGVYGLKLSHGSVPTDGVFAISASWDCVGVMARDPADLAPLAEALALRPGLRAAVGAGSETGFEALRIGVTETTWGVDRGFSRGKWEEPDVVEAYEAAVRKMEASGANVVFPLAMPDADTITHEGQTVMTTSYYEFPAQVEAFIDCFHPDPEITNLQDIIAWNEKHKDVAMPEPCTTQTELAAALASPLSAGAHVAAVSALRRLAGPDGIVRAMAAHGGLDVVLAPSESTLVCYSACARLPVAAVPLGRWRRNGQPYGMFAVAGPGREDVLLRFMGAWHAVLGGVEGPAMDQG
ncbi:putative amidase [Tolypocladium ophioglossoides CBS 100239]|uniref:Putative amidase n=1 Tax=Tolypocladium ophioglossoides (strain CBS 100239) TaxID=1163406 RepID=A0A0L0N4Q1_TOLOC|nr:putative amidase [Tolypocladium ophioglossoides CBS 100239]